MVAVKVTKEYDRHFFEVQQQSENGKWYRMCSGDFIEGDNEKEMVQNVLDAVRKQINWTKGLEGFLPSDLLRVGALRLVRVHRNSKVLGFFDVKKALRATKISSKI